MAECGESNIVSISRSGTKHPQSRAFIQKMEGKGVRVVSKTCDVAIKEVIAALVREAAYDDGLPPIRGVIQPAIVLKVRSQNQASRSNRTDSQDSIFEAMSFD